MPFPSTHPALARALAERAYLEPTPVQAAVLEEHTEGRDLLVSAQTGSGKTVAYGLALAATLLGESERFDRAAEPLALIVAPTRELALQVRRELEWLYAAAGARVVSCVGGMDVRREQRALSDGAHIVVGTPGRLRDHLERGRLDTSTMRAVVLDEADEMLDLGFREDLKFILDATPEGRRTLLLSATIPRDIVALAKQYQRDALRIDTIVQNQPHGDIEYRAIGIAPNDIEHAVVNVLRFYDYRATLVFCSTREAVRRLHGSLLERGFAVVALSGELSQSERTHALQSLRDGRSSVCVATDVAARGLDLPNVGLVIHADLPNDPEMLLHRSGRTGRAGRKGICALLVPYTRRRRAESLLSGAGVDAAWVGPPTAEEIRVRDQERLVADPLLAETSSDEDLVLARALLSERSAEEVAAALIRMHRSRLPAPEDILDTGPMRDTRNTRDSRDGRAHRGDVSGRPQGDPRHAQGEMIWFRMSVGRQNNADPRWLLPMICRLGHVTKKEIGAIKIYDRETRFEIVKDVAARFAAAVRKSGEEEIRIQPDDRTAMENNPAGAFKKKPYRGKHPPDVRDGKPQGSDRGPSADRPKRAQFGEQPTWEFGQTSDIRPDSRPHLKTPHLKTPHLKTPHVKSPRAGFDRPGDARPGGPARMDRPFKGKRPRPESESASAPFTGEPGGFDPPHAHPKPFRKRSGT